MGGGTRVPKIQEILMRYLERLVSCSSPGGGGDQMLGPHSCNMVRVLSHWKCRERSGSVVRVLDSRPRGCRLEPHQRHCVVSLSKNINPSLVLVQPRKTRPFITERLLMGRKESNQTIGNIGSVSMIHYEMLSISASTSVIMQKEENI